MALLRLQPIKAQDPGCHGPIRRRHPLGGLRPGCAYGLIALSGLLDGSRRQRHLRGVDQCAADLRHRPLTSEAAMAPPTQPLPAAEPPRLRQSRFGIRAARLGTRGALAVRAVGQLAYHFHRPWQGQNAVSTMSAAVQSPSTHATNVVFHFSNHTRASDVCGPTVTHGSPPWQRNTARCHWTLLSRRVPLRL
jgi:hypothetical protein